MSTTKPTVGVLALQGGIAEHLAALERCGATAKSVRRPEELAEVHGLVLPGGESTAMSVRALATLSDGGPHVTPGHNATGRIVAVQQGPVFATAFHPELVRGDERVHRYFVQTIRAH